ncbi:MAG TPA: 5-oxoprolinase subunit PxpA [Syntrophorhabdaceae bacterium]|nr:5-oxoprolinase subunit PxpA [Syntrophorhabdaceae bacterium]HOL04510.1 5-oxoprolinase subunit PxpA [Syntrophorhabdaceae bacterium]HPC67466.1 5-oxoprolinase subunit PxpA [Syntrophorhabdaceae bacterium]HPP42295.1 5-oxoprolinase subunit PxpA [Syntrophorhabdaceae bacterium]HRR72315.1 5-oxoprolinase subunit PxpA [Syntrophorhabdaceae bacterium]
MIKAVDINCDMGESFGDYKIGNDDKVVPYITSANIACGFHASDPNVIDKTVRLCKSHNVMCGAHPGYPDLMGFGRRFMDVAETELINYIVYQVGAVKGFMDLYGVVLQHVKLHGALYNYMVNQEGVFLKIIDTLKKAFGDIIFLTLGTGKTSGFKKRCRDMGIKIALEAFPDRNYTDEGELLPRKYKDAVLHDNELIARRAVQMVKEQGIRSINGRWIDMDIDTLCIHGDNEESIEAAKKIRDYIIQEGIEVKPLSGFIK